MKLVAQLEKPLDLAAENLRIDEPRVGILEIGDDEPAATRVIAKGFDLGLAGASAFDEGDLLRTADHEHAVVVFVVRRFDARGVPGKDGAPR